MFDNALSIDVYPKKKGKVTIGKVPYNMYARTLTVINIDYSYILYNACISVAGRR